MPRLFFDIEDDGNLRRDIEGIEIADEAAARSEAVQTLVGLAKDWLPRNGKRRTITILVRTGDDRHLFKAALSYEEGTG